MAFGQALNTPHRLTNNKVNIGEQKLRIKIATFVYQIMLSKVKVHCLVKYVVITPGCSLLLYYVRSLWRDTGLDRRD